MKSINSKSKSKDLIFKVKFIIITLVLNIYKHVLYIRYKNIIYNVNQLSNIMGDKHKLYKFTIESVESGICKHYDCSYLLEDYKKNNGHRFYYNLNSSTKEAHMFGTLNVYSRANYVIINIVIDYYNLKEYLTRNF